RARPARPEGGRVWARLLRPAGAPVPARPGPRAGTGPVPATALQARLFARERAGQGAGGTGSHAVRLTGRLDEGRLRDALTAVLARHEALRSRIVDAPDGGPGAAGPSLHGQVAGAPVAAGPAGGGQASVGTRPLLVVDGEPCLRLTRTDLSLHSERAREEAVARHVEENAAAELSLAAGRTSAFRLLRLGRDEHVLVLASHLAVFDGWSSGVFLGDLAAAYREGPVSLPAPELQFPDHADWQRRWLASAEGAGELARTRAEFTHSPPAPRAARFERGVLPVRMDRSPGSALHTGLALGAAEGATPFMTLVAALAVVLARRDGNSHAVVGTPAAGRFAGQLEGAVGQFTTVVPIGVDLSGGPTFTGLLHRTRTAVAEALSRQRLPFDELFPAGAQPYGVLFALHNYPAVPLGLPGIEVGQLPGPPARHLELYSPDPAATLACVGLVERDGGIGGTAEFNRAAAGPEDVTALLTGIEDVLAVAAAAPGAVL
ncbi:condensation domain-containing protein, partial [Streptomyces sp. NPDC060194]|uniref:condensation domain-containing protein n=1 Tax=Streptomyces sp. NPDC060194 TaxID=3347069 RepID=UPI00365187ED